MRDDERAPEPCMCGDPACPVCGAGRESYLCEDCPCVMKQADDESTFVCAMHGAELECNGNELHCCPACTDRRDAARATAAREWDEMADATEMMLPDACRQRWIDGAVRYGQAWQSEGRKNVDEAREELYDAINYLLAAGARGQLSAKHAQRFVEQVVDLLDRLYWVQAKFGREEAGADG